MCPVPENLAGGLPPADTFVQGIVILTQRPEALSAWLAGTELASMSCDLRKRNLLATLMLSQGTPMLLAGDELGHSQAGNNNAYAQDNDLTRIDWGSADTVLIDFVARLTALRKAHPVLRQTRFLHSQKRLADGLPDAIWRRADAAIPSPNDWHDPAFRCIGLELRMAAEGPDQPDALYVVFNGGGALALRLPETAAEWRLVLDSTRPDLAPEPYTTRLNMPPQSVFVFEPLLTGGST